MWQDLIAILIVAACVVAAVVYAVRQVRGHKSCCSGKGGGCSGCSQGGGCPSQGGCSGCSGCHKV